MKDAVIFLPLGMETDEPAHPYQQPAEIRRIADASPKQTGYVLFPKVTKFSTYLFRRYGKRIEAELAEGIKAGVYAMMLGLNGEEAGQVRCRLSPGMSLWRVNRYEFIADIPVEIRCETAAGEGHAEAYVTLNCCLDEDFCYFIDNVSMEKPDRALIRLDEYLVPVMSYEDLEVATREAWEQYLPEVFASHEWLNPYRLAERMGLKVAFHRVYRRKKNRGLLFWKEGMLKVVIHTDEGDTITLRLPAIERIVLHAVEDHDKIGKHGFQAGIKAFVDIPIKVCKLNAAFDIIEYQIRDALFILRCFSEIADYSARVF